MQAYSAFNLYNGLAVNTHLARVAPYTNIDKTIACIKALGFPLLRDACTYPTLIPAWKKVAEATGVKFISYQTSGQQEWMRDCYKNTKALYDDGLIAYLEGANEPDGDYSTSPSGYKDKDGKDLFTPNSIPAAQAFQKEIWDEWNGKVRIINMSLGKWTDKNGNLMPKGNYDKLGDMSAVCNYSNAHTYPEANETPHMVFDHINPLAQMTAPSRPMAHSEYGYTNTVAYRSGVPEAVSGIYLAQAMLSFVPKGISLWGIFELLDQKTGDPDSEKNFGLFRSDYTPKPAVALLSGLAKVFKEAKKVDTKPVDIQITGLKTTHNCHLHQMDETKYVLVIWREDVLCDPKTKKDLRTGARDIVTVKFPNAKLKAPDAISWVDPTTTTSLSVSETPTLLMLDLVQARYTEADLDAAYKAGERAGEESFWKKIDGLRGKV